MRLPFLSSLVRRIGLDLGTQTTRIWTDKDGVVLHEPSCVALDTQNRKVIAVGSEALAMRGRVAEHIQIVFPIKNGVIYDPETAKIMVRLFLHSVLKTPYFFRPLMMASVPSGATAAQRQALRQVLKAVGASEVYTMSQPLAAAIGSGVPIADASGTFLMQLGYGVTESAIISLGSVVAKKMCFSAGESLITQLQSYIEDQVGLVVSFAMASKLLHQVASLAPTPQRQILVAGQDIATNSPREMTISAEILQSPVDVVVEEYVAMLKQLLSAIPPELTVDVIDKGMLLAGGLAQLHGLETTLVQRLGVAVTVVDEPELAVIKGLGVALENVELLKESLGYQS